MSFKFSPIPISKTGPGVAAAPSAPSAPSAAESALVANQRMIIIILMVILVFSLMGGEAFTVINNALAYIYSVVMKVVVYVASNLGYSTGSMLNTTTNVAANVAVSSVQVADGAINSFGDIFREANSKNVSPEIKQQMDQMVNTSQDFLLLPRGGGGGGGAAAPPASHGWSVGSGGGAAAGGGNTDSLRRDLDDVINKVNRLEKGDVREDSAGGIIQKRSIVSADKNAWCLVGSLGGKRSCISVQPGDKCGYARLYDNKESCMANTA